MSDIRLLRQQDIPSVMRLNRAANWNQTEEDWARVLRLEPEGCFVIEAGGQPVATATAVCYAQRLSWIGMVLTDPAYRGRGYARRLMERCIEFLEHREVEWIKLDATDMGHPLYLKLGFEDESFVERWARQPAACAPGQPVQPLAVDFELDREAVGADRHAMLADLAQTGASASFGSGYAFSRAGTVAAYFGPCVARDAASARNLLQSFLAAHPSELVYWDILPDNREALALAAEFGFELRRRLIRQVRPGVAKPNPFPHRDDYVFAIAGFEYG